MKKLLYLLTILLLASCGKKNPRPIIQGDTTKTNTADSTKIEIDTLAPDYIAIDLVLKLPEVIELGHTIEKKSKGKHHLSAMITETPDVNGEGYYVVQVSEDTEVRLVGIYTFNVYVPPYEVMFCDPVKGEEVSLEKWRKERKK